MKIKFNYQFQHEIFPAICCCQRRLEFKICQSDTGIINITLKMKKIQAGATDPVYKNG